VVGEGADAHLQFWVKCALTLMKNTIANGTSDTATKIPELPLPQQIFNIPQRHARRAIDCMTGTICTFHSLS
jgi:hypothetical protein